ncbi:MAG TPA: hypothetical protein VFC63_05670 [Blastocatellia bacterium]|nr:hypothetical protein [Blastocatellia bacterium]
MQDRIENIMSQIRRLPVDERLKLIQRIAADLTPNAQNPMQHSLVYGKYNRQDKMSTEDDFKLAEWHPSENEMNGH